MTRFCRLCGSELAGKNKVRSHALTDSTYFKAQKNIRPTSSPLKAVSENFSPKDAGHFTTEYAFCLTCERMFSVWEQEREKLFSECPAFTKSPEEMPLFETNKYNADYIKLACMTDLFRCSVFESEVYSKVSLGEKHENIIRDILLGNINIQKDLYPVILRRFNDSNKLVKEISEIPRRSRMSGGIRIYQTIAPRGWYWTIKVDNRPWPHESLNHLSLCSDESIKILNFGDFSQSAEFKQIVKLILEHFK